ncbi:hypothetical protein KC347_g251 [Hortaea werneckii]|nr:hypothetical protein KC347_g251 [Hortaea werneckii]
MVKRAPVWLAVSRRGKAGEQLCRQSAADAAAAVAVAAHCPGGYPGSELRAPRMPGARVELWYPSKPLCRAGGERRMKGSNAGGLAVFCSGRGRREEKSGVVVVTSVVVGRRRVSSSVRRTVQDMDAATLCRWKHVSNLSACLHPGPCRKSKLEPARPAQERGSAESAIAYGLSDHPSKHLGSLAAGRTGRHVIPAAAH